MLHALGPVVSAARRFRSVACREPSGGTFPSRCLRLVGDACAVFPNSIFLFEHCLRFGRIPEENGESGGFLTRLPDRSNGATRRVGQQSRPTGDGPEKKRRKKREKQHPGTLRLACPKVPQNLKECHDGNTHTKAATGSPL